MQCKFCSYEWSHDNPCEKGYDHDTGEVYYCGNQACPACGSCQGRTDVTPYVCLNAAMTRAIFEKRSFSWIADRQQYN
jgi:hypothetical protein